MQTPFTAYRIVRIEGWYDTDKTNEEDAIAEATSQVVSEALSNVLYNGEQNGVSISDVVDCGESE